MVRAASRAVRRLFAVITVLGLLGNGASMAMMATSAAGGVAHHGSGHRGSNHHDPDSRPDRHATDCCDLCLVHCLAGLHTTGSVAVEQSPLAIQANTNIRGTGLAFLPPVRHRLPPSQAPPSVRS